jgi:hypothetical protein
MQLFACQKVAAWIERQLGVFTSGVYGGTLDETRNIMDDFEEYKLVLEVQKAVRNVVRHPRSPPPSFPLCFVLKASLMPGVCYPPRRASPVPVRFRSQGRFRRCWGVQFPL